MMQNILPDCRIGPDYSVVICIAHASDMSKNSYILSPNKVCRLSIECDILELMPVDGKWLLSCKEVSHCGGLNSALFFHFTHLMSPSTYRFNISAILILFTQHLVAQFYSHCFPSWHKLFPILTFTEFQLVWWWLGKGGTVGVILSHLDISMIYSADHQASSLSWERWYLGAVQAYRQREEGSAWTTFAPGLHHLQTVFYRSTDLDLLELKSCITLCNRLTLLIFHKGRES